MSHHQILENEFESNLCDELAERGWLYKSAGDPNAASWDIARAMVPADVLCWLATQYPDEYEKAVPSDLTNGALALAQRKLLDHIIKELSKTTKMDPITGHPVGGLLGVLRRGFKFAQIGRPAASFGPLMSSRRRTRTSKASSSSPMPCVCACCVRCVSTPRPTRPSTSCCAPTACRWPRSN